MASEGIVQLDEDGEYQLLHYALDQTPSSENAHYRGVIVNRDNSIVANSHPYTPEEPFSDQIPFPSHNNQIPFPSHNKAEVTVAYEGTVVRLWWKNDTRQWQFSTYKKINGTRSKWSNRAFYEYFCELFPQEAYERLDTNKCYSFLLCHQNLKLAADVARNRLIFTMKWLVNEQRYESVKDDTTFDGIESIELPEFVSAFVLGNQEEGSTGYLVTVFNEDNTQLQCIKYLFTEYEQDRAVRGNEPNLRMAYYHALNQGNGEHFRRVMHDRESELNVYDGHLEMLRTELLKQYECRFVREERCEFIPEFYSILKNIRVNRHQEYCEGNDETKYDIVASTVAKYNARVLNACVKYITTTPP